MVNKNVVFADLVVFFCIYLSSIYFNVKKYIKKYIFLKKSKKKKFFIAVSFLQYYKLQSLIKS